MENRYSAHPHPAGLVVLDQVTGELTLVPGDGQQVRELRSPRAPRPAPADRATPPPWERPPPAPERPAEGAAPRPPEAPSEPTSIDDVREIAAAATRRHLDALRARGAYLAELTVAGRAARREVERFLRAEHDAPDERTAPPPRGRGLCVTGAPGVGKTALLARAAEEHLAGDVVVLCDASSAAGDDLEAAVADALQPRDRERTLRLAEVLLRLDGAARASGARLVVLVDGVTGGPARAPGHLGQISALLERLAPHPWARLVVALQHAAGDAPDDLPGFLRCEVGAFTDEELVRAYRLLQRGRVRAAPTTDADALRDLPAESRAVLRHPATLRALAEGFDGRPLPIAFLLEAAASLRLDRLAGASTGGARAAAWLRHVAERMDALGDDRAALADLEPPPLDGGAAEAARTLVAEGLLAWADGGESRLRFASAAMLHHLVAARHLAALGDGADLCALVGRRAASPVFRASLRALLLGLVREGRAALLAAAVGRPDADDALLDAATQALSHLGAVDAARHAEALDALLAQPGAGALAVAVGALERLTWRGVPPVLARLAGAVDRAGDAPAPPALRRRRRLALLRAYAVLEREDQVERLLGQLERDPEAADDPEVLVERAWLRRESAPALLDRVEAPAARPGARVAARAGRLRAQLAIEAGELDRARRLARDAAELAGRAGDDRERCAALVQLAWVERQGGDLDALSRLLADVLPLAEAVGDLHLQRQAAGTRAIERRERADYAAALEHAERALALALRAEEPRALQTALLNLGAFRIDVGDHAGAEPLLRHAAELARRLQRPRSELAALVVLAEAERAQPGGPERALATLDWAITVARRESISAHEPRWSRWCITRSAEDALAWTEDVRGLAPTPLLDAQAAALALDDALRRGDVAAAVARFEEVDRGLARQRPRPEVQELPLAVLPDVVEFAARRGEPGIAARAVAAGRAWLCGRPSAALDALASRLRRAPGAGLAP